MITDFFFVLVVFAMDFVVGRTVRPLFTRVFGDLSFDLVWSNCECVIRLVPVTN